MTQPMSVLFVCLGNIVRSPLAEHLFRKSVQETASLGGIRIDSAGTSSWHIGEQPDSRMRRTAEKHGLKYDGRARRVTHDDLEAFDLIIVMDESNYASIKAMTTAPSHIEKIRLLREFDPEAGHDLAVPDPYYGGQDGFERTFQIVSRSIEGLVQAIQDDSL